MGVVIIWIGLQVVFGTENPFYVVASGSMIPKLQVYDVLIVQGHVQFEDVQIGDIIVFDRPSGQDRVIVHRVVSITDDDPKTLRTKGDNNVASIPGTDFPITEIAYNVGFNDSNYFSTVFRKSVGISPSIYRKSQKP